jgi:hypothetical protein
VLVVALPCIRPRDRSSQIAGRTPPIWLVAHLTFKWHERARQFNAIGSLAFPTPFKAKRGRVRRCVACRLRVCLRGSDCAGFFLRRWRCGLRHRVRRRLRHLWLCHGCPADVKFLERFAGTRKSLYQFTAIDDCTRIRVLKIYDACNQTSAIRFGMRSSDGCRFVCWLCKRIIVRSSGPAITGIWKPKTSVNVYIRPRTPHVNGKVERSHRSMNRSFYQLLDKDGIVDDIHLSKTTASRSPTA